MLRVYDGLKESGAVNLHTEANVCLNTSADRENSCCEQPCEWELRCVWLPLERLALAQTPPSAVRTAAPAAAPLRPAIAQAPPDQTVTGGKLHGVVKSGNYSVAGRDGDGAEHADRQALLHHTDITGAWSLTIPQNGRYVIRTQFAAFAQGAQEAVLNADQPRPDSEFRLILASRAAQQEQQQEGQVGRRWRRPSGNWPGMARRA